MQIEDKKAIEGGFVDDRSLGPGADSSTPQCHVLYILVFYPLCRDRFSVKAGLMTPLTWR